MRSGGNTTSAVASRAGYDSGIANRRFPSRRNVPFSPIDQVAKRPHAPVVQLRHPQHSDQPLGPTIIPAVRTAPSQTLVAHWKHAIP